MVGLTLKPQPEWNGDGGSLLSFSHKELYSKAASANCGIKFGEMGGATKLGASTAAQQIVSTEEWDEIREEGET